MELDGDRNGIILEDILSSLLRLVNDSTSDIRHVATKTRLIM